LAKHEQRVDRRVVLGALGLGALGLARPLAACNSSGAVQSGGRAPGAGGGSVPASSGALSGESACVPTPAQTEGPYFFETGLMRSDIRDGKRGALLGLELRVVRADGCSPLPGALVEAWHADAAGNYSGFGRPDGNRVNAGGQRFLRGFQATDAEGRVRFMTIYPGWYPGRAPHVHLMVRAKEGTLLTTQLYFPEELSETVYATAPYAGRRGRHTTNTADAIEDAALLGQVSATAEGYSTFFRIVVRS
jgi:protocatechuate 3,4-dioxygenase beta subunit